MTIDTRRFSFESRFDGVRIHGICMVPEHPIGILQMVHGMSEHKERYLSFMQNMAERGYIVLMHDNRGHGESIKSKDDIGYCYDSMEVGFVGDIYRVTQNIKKEYPELPLILYGHSMGSLAVRAYLRNHDDAIDALILSGCPAYKEVVPAGIKVVRKLKKQLGERYRSAFLQQLVLGGFDKPFKAEKRKNAWIAAKESVVNEFEKDELCTFTYTLNGFETLLNLEYITYQAIGYQMKNEKLPILFISGKDDPCYINERKWKQAINRMHNLGYQNVEDTRYNGMRHEIHNEDGNDKVYDAIDTFCKKVIKGNEH